MTTIARPQSITLRVAWGKQWRNQCPGCRLFLKSGETVTCGRCRVVYVAQGDGTYRREWA